MAAEDQAQVLADLANQEELYLALYVDDLCYRFTRDLPHSRQQWQELDELVCMASEYLRRLAPESRDYERAKAEFISNTT